MDQAKLITKLQALQRLATECLEEMSRGVVQDRKPQNTLMRKKGKSGSGITASIKRLVASSFFAQPKSDLEVVNALKKIAHPSTRSSVSVTLMRFVQRGLLTREGAGTKDNPWKYVVP